MGRGYIVVMTEEDKKTSWGRVAGWYDELLAQEGTYQKELILPHLRRLMNIQKGAHILDLACGPGFFSREFAALGAEVTGVDISKEIIARAEKNTPKELHVSYHASPAHKLEFIQEKSMNEIALVLALQNMDDPALVVTACGRVLKLTGRIHIVINHPAFRVPESSSWGWDKEQNIQYRRIDAYLTEKRVRIAMHPGSDPSLKTVSYHRPLQFYFKALVRAGFVVSSIEEWTSHKKSGVGPRQTAENRSRREIPLFLYMQACQK